MADDKKSDEKKEGGLVEKVVDRLPLDEARPAVREAGRLVETLLMAANAPFEGIRERLLIGRMERDQRIKERIEAVVTAIPVEHRQLPPSRVSLPILEGVILSEEEPDIQTLFLNLLKSGMNSTIAGKVHPSFPHLIEQMSSQEARIMTVFADEGAQPVIDIVLKPILSHSIGYEEPPIVVINLDRILEHAGYVEEGESVFPSSASVTNLIRLGLIQVSDHTHLAPEKYDELENHPYILDLIAETRKEVSGLTPTILQKGMVLTPLGERFCDACIDVDAIRLGENVNSEE